MFLIQTLYVHPFGERERLERMLLLDADFADGSDPQEAYLRLKRGEALRLTSFNLREFEGEAPSLLMSEIPLHLAEEPDGVWILSSKS